MFNDAAQIVSRFSGLHAVVVGEAMLDRYSTGYSRRLCPEGPVPVVDACSTVNVAGAAANTAVNLRSLGARVSLVTAIGDDAEGTAILDLLAQRDVGVEHVHSCSTRTTISKHRVLAGNQILLRFDQGTTSPVAEDIEVRLVDSLHALQAEADLLVVSDYAYGIVTDAVAGCLRQRRNRRRPTLVVDSKRLVELASLEADMTKPNYCEAIEVLGLKPNPAVDRSKQVLHHSRELLRRCGSRIVAVTLDDEGAVVLQSGSAARRTSTQPAPNCQAAGAGDTYLSAFGLALAAGAGTGDAADMAAAAARVVVSRNHTAACSAEDLLSALGEELRPGDMDGLTSQIERHRQMGRRIVLTCGCFDILHRGHVTFLERAKSLGDVLIVGVNSSDSIRRLKGPERPINSLEDRLGVLASLSCIDHLTSFDELTPDRVIHAVQPDVFVKGGDYTKKMLPEAPLVEELGGRVVILPYLVNHSTSRIIDRIRDTEGRPERPSIENNGNGYTGYAHDAHPIARNGDRNNVIRELVRRTRNLVR